MAIPMDHSSSSSDDTSDPNTANDNGYQRISDHEPISSHNPIPWSNGTQQNNNNSEPSHAQNDTTTISYNGIEIQVFGDVAGLTAGLQAPDGFSNHDDLDTDEEEEEEKRREEAEAAIREANRADWERRNSPLNPETRSAVINAMRGISLEGFRPDWADAIPEHQWIERLRGSREAPRQS